jgi:hypothetical protein
LDSLDKEDRWVLLKMILDISIYKKDISSMINIENSESYSDFMFFMLIIVLQQKNLDRLKEPGNKKDTTLLDFMSK